jgi:peptidoglycan/LPS O-acetylase OafA/YrhL
VSLTEKRPAKAKYYVSLDGLRGTGVIAMLLYHANVGVASGAFLAVSMFFTLSGYMIGGQLHGEFERTRRIDLKKFWERRIRRLMPAASLSLMGATLYTAVFARPVEIARFAGDILAALFYVPNWRFVVTDQNYDAIFSNPSPVQHYWSLGVEEQFYIALPLFFWFVLSRSSTRTLAIVTGIIALASSFAMYMIRVPDSPLGHAYYGTDVRVSEVLGGVLLALWYRNGLPFTTPRSKTLVSIAGFIAIAVMYSLWLTTHETQLWFYQGGALAYTLVAMVVVTSCIQGGLLDRLLCLGPLPYIGRISYGLYVYHWPIYLAVGALSLGLPPWLEATVKIGITLIVSIISHRYIETPIRIGAWFTGPRNWLVPIAAALAITVAATALIATAPYVAPIEEVKIDLPEQPLLEFDALSTGAPAASTGPPRVIVTGDSMAGAIGRGLASWGEETGDLAAAVHSVPACGLALEGERRLGNSTADATASMCETMQKHWKSGVVLPRHDAIVLIIGTMDLIDRRLDTWDEFRSPGDPVFDEWIYDVYNEKLDILLAGGVKVVWLNYPCAGSEEYLQSHQSVFGIPLIAAAAFDSERIQQLNAVLLPRLQAERPDDLRVVNLYDHVCPGGIFSPSLGNVSQARDDGVHFGEAGGRELANWLGPEVLKAIESLPPNPAHKTRRKSRQPRRAKLKAKPTHSVQE